MYIVHKDECSASSYADHNFKGTSFLYYQKRYLYTCTHTHTHCSSASGKSSFGLNILHVVCVGMYAKNLMEICYASLRGNPLHV